MPALTEADLPRVRAAQRKVFARLDPMEPPFHPWIPERAILHPSHTHFRGSELDALVAAARAVGDAGFYVSLIDSHSTPAEPGDWYIPLDDLSTYSDSDVGIDSAMYSPNGRWGIITCHEHFSLAGGSSLFIEVFLRRLGRTVDQQAWSFVSDWRHQEQVFHDLNQSWLGGWIPALLEHMIGPSRAREVLEATKIDAPN